MKNVTDRGIWWFLYHAKQDNKIKPKKVLDKIIIIISSVFKECNEHYIWFIKMSINLTEKRILKYNNPETYRYHYIYIRCTLNIPRIYQNYDIKKVSKSGIGPKLLYINETLISDVNPQLKTISLEDARFKFKK